MCLRGSSFQKLITCELELTIDLHLSGLLNSGILEPIFIGTVCRIHRSGNTLYFPPNSCMQFNKYKQMDSGFKAI